MKKLSPFVILAALCCSASAFSADMYVRTSGSGWQNQPMFRDFCRGNNLQDCIFASGTFTAVPSDQFKFDLTGDWSTNYGDNNTADSYLDKSGANITLGNQYNQIAYEFNANKGKPFYRIHPDGCTGLGVWGNLYNQSQHLYGRYVGYGQYSCYRTIYFPVPGGQFFFTNGLEKLGDPNNNLQLTPSLTAISAPKAGEYKLTYSSNWGNPTYTISQYGSMNVRGSFNAWANASMTMVKPFIWSANVSFTANTPVVLKFDAFGDWATSFGDTNGDKIAEQNGANISVTSPTTGSYPVRFNESTGRYAVCAPNAASYHAQTCQ